MRTQQKERRCVAAQKDRAKEKTREENGVKLTSTRIAKTETHSVEIQGFQETQAAARNPCSPSRVFGNSREH